ncbi:MAG: penicillin-binding protein 2 [Chthoniobacterales bacterium]
MTLSSHYFRFYTLAAIFLGLLSILAVRLWYVQIVRGEEYAAKVKGNSKVTVRLPAVRGEILDRNGIKLVENRASFDVDFYLPGMVREYRKKHGRSKVPTTTYRATWGMPKDIRIADIVEIVHTDIIPRLNDLGLAGDYNTEELEMHFQRNSEVPFNYLQNVDFDTMVRFEERNLNIPGVSVEIKPTRNYIYGAFASHLLGYVGAPINIDGKDAKKYNFYQPDLQGKSQVEFAMDEYLRGTPGVRILEKNVKGVLTGESERIEPTQGDNVYLTIDARLQYIVEKTLRVVGRGAAVLVDPDNGNILAMASVPSFDPNMFIPSISASLWSELQKDKTDPLVNRALSAYPPGSTYKIPVSLAGLRAGIGNNHYNCSGGIQYGNHYMKCWLKSGHGTLNLESAIKNSCNPFFYQYANTANSDQIVALGNMLGLGQKSGLPLSGEAGGVLPSKEWLAKNHPRERWSRGTTANMSIGQGYVLASPLQMAMIAATVANGGTCYYPRLIDRVVAQDGNVVLEEPTKVRSNLITDAGLTTEQIEHVRKGMWKVINEAGGTARRGRIKGIKAAGKTGTAQFWRSSPKGRIQDNLTWFLSFAPYEKPRYAICVMVEGGKSGGNVAAPIAAKILEDSLKLDDSEAEPVEVVKLEPAKGNFLHVDLVDFGREIPASVGSSSEDGETASTVASASSNVQRARDTASPRIRKDADERGKVKKKNKRPAIQRFFDMFRRKDRKNQ